MANPKYTRKDVEIPKKWESDFNVSIKLSNGIQLSDISSHILSVVNL